MKNRLFITMMTVLTLGTVVPVYAEETLDVVLETGVGSLGYEEEIIDLTDIPQNDLDYIESLTAVNEELPGNQESYTYLGTFKLTAYCPCYSCNYPFGGQPTAYGTDYVEGRTIAVDDRVIPLGTIVEINIPGEGWHRYRAEDTGGKIKGNRIDILVSNHSKCNQKQYNSHCEVRIVN